MGDKVLGILSPITNILKKPKAPKASTSAVESAETDKADTKTKRAALYETKGGVLGEELDASGVEKRNTLFGN